MKLLIQIIPSFIFITFCFVPAWIVIKFYNYKIKNKKSPLNIDLLRSPGESLQKEIDDITDEILYNFAILPIIPVITYSVLISNYYTRAKNFTSNAIIYISFIGIIISTVIITRKIYILLNKKNILRLGLECEKAIGQSLEDLRKFGFRIYHDFKTDGFNIDHIAVGPTGIFSIETKGRSKSIKVENKNWKVEFDGERLIFPNWTEKQPVLQTINQAEWLKKWIERSTGGKINVTPVLALPGWFISRKVNSTILTINGKNIDFIGKGRTIITNKQIEMISFQLEKNCRDIPPKSYKKIAQQSH